MTKLFANSGDPDQTPRSGASDLGLHCLPITLLRVSRLQWVKVPITTTADNILNFFFFFFYFSKKKRLFFSFFFSQKIGCEISCKLSPQFPKETICLKCQSIFSGKKKKKYIITLPSAEFTQRVVKV